tara:strand:- start:18 stop:599 length:582 start_codon:yes stop_codon:yes gene_type:complete
VLIFSYTFKEKISEITILFLIVTLKNFTKDLKKKKLTFLIQSELLFIRMKLRIKAFNDRARELYENHSHFHTGDAGLDLFVVEDQIIPAKSTQPIPLQIACENLDNKAYYLFPRSSISKTPLRLANSIGLIDGGYRGELVGMVDNIYNEDFHVKRGERYFQLVAVDSSPIDFELVEELSKSSRGEGGFGSTGR